MSSHNKEELKYTRLEEFSERKGVLILENNVIKIYRVVSKEIRAGSFLVMKPLSSLLSVFPDTSEIMSQIRNKVLIV